MGTHLQCKPCLTEWTEAYLFLSTNICNYHKDTICIRIRYDMLSGVISDIWDRSNLRVLVTHGLKVVIGLGNGLAHISHQAEPRATCCENWPWEQISIKFESKYNNYKKMSLEMFGKYHLFFLGFSGLNGKTLIKEYFLKWVGVNHVWSCLKHVWPIVHQNCMSQKQFTEHHSPTPSLAHVGYLYPLYLWLSARLQLTPLLTHQSYYSVAPSHRCILC